MGIYTGATACSHHDCETRTRMSTCSSSPTLYFLLLVALVVTAGSAATFGSTFLTALLAGAFLTTCSSGAFSFSAVTVLALLVGADAVVAVLVEADLAVVLVSSAVEAAAAAEAEAGAFLARVALAGAGTGIDDEVDASA